MRKTIATVAAFSVQESILTRAMGFVALKEMQLLLYTQFGKLKYVRCYKCAVLQPYVNLAYVFTLICTETVCLISYH